MWQDHKPGDKNRPIVTGCTSNTRGLSNSVSDVLEAVANNEKRPYKVNSGEDMLARVHKCNKKTMAIRVAWMSRRFEKIISNCETCPSVTNITHDCAACDTAGGEGKDRCSGTLLRSA